jgi:hypothetical protein
MLLPFCNLITNLNNNNYLPIQIVKLKRKPLLARRSKGFINCWATTGQQNLLKQVKPQHKEEKESDCVKSVFVLIISESEDKILS